MIYLASILSFALGALIVGHMAYGRGYDRANREWLARKNLNWKRVTVIKGAGVNE